MKPKTFTYNQIIQFFIANNAPLNEKQVSIIALKVKEELSLIEAYRAREKIKKDAAFIRREKRKLSRINDKLGA